MSKKSMKQHEQRKSSQNNMQPVLPPKKVKKREIEAWILAILMIAWTVCSVLGTIGFCRTQASAECADAVEIASIEEEMAVECYTAYNSKRILSNAVENTDYYTFNIDLFSSMVFRDENLYSSCFAGYWQLEFNHLSAMLYYINGVNQVSFDLFNVDTSSIDYWSFNPQSVVFDFSNSGVVEVSASNSSYSNPNRDPLNSIPDLRSFYPRQFRVSFVGYDIGIGGAAFEIGVEFYNNVSGASQYIFILIDTNFIELGSFYYTSRGLDTDSGYVPIYGATFGEITYQDGYNAGYDEGFSYGKDIGRDEGREMGYDEGFSNGRTAGYNAGLADGFTAGVNSANEYTFQGLIGAVFDAPIQAFQGLFSFEILGVDLSGFLLSLLTVMIALSIIKLII